MRCEHCFREMKNPTRKICDYSESTTIVLSTKVVYLCEECAIRDELKFYIEQYKDTGFTTDFIKYCWEALDKLNKSFRQETLKNLPQTRRQEDYE